MSYSAWRRIVWCYHLAFLAAVTWPGQTLVNTPDPFVAGLPRQMALIAVLIVGSLIVLWRMDMARRRDVEPQPRTPDHARAEETSRPCPEREPTTMTASEPTKWIMADITASELSDLIKIFGDKPTVQSLTSYILKGIANGDYEISEDHLAKASRFHGNRMRDKVRRRTRDRVLPAPPKKWIYAEITASELDALIDFVGDKPTVQSLTSYILKGTANGDYEISEDHLASAFRFHWDRMERLR